MVIKEIYYTIGAVLFSFGGAGFIIICLSSWLGKIWANRILTQDKARYNREIEEVKSKFSRELEYYKSQIEFYKLSLLRYSEHQFSLYNKLWVSLAGLKIAGDKLWDRIDENSILDFVVKVKKAKEDLLKNVLLIEDAHEKELTELLEKFANYSLGKYKLIELDKQKKDEPQNWFSSLLANAFIRQDIIKDNNTTKEAYDKLLLSIKASFRKQLKEGILTNNAEK